MTFDGALSSTWDRHLAAEFAAKSPDQSLATTAEPYVNDALVPDDLEPSPLPLKLRPDNPELLAASRALYGSTPTDTGAATLQDVGEAKKRTMREMGDAYPVWVLDHLGIDIMLGNRVAMGRGLTAPRFRWVAYDDALLLPLDAANERRLNPDAAAFYPSEQRLLQRDLSELGVSSLPATLPEYLSRVVTPTLEQQKVSGALAVKFEAAYLRALDFAAASEADAADVYARYAGGYAPPSVAEYEVLQDFLFRFIAREAGRLEQTAALLVKPNVYADFSAQTSIRYPRDLSGTIRRWLEVAPEKVLFATDAFALTPEIGWEEVGWRSARTGRHALALALTGMLRDDEITRERASELARMVLRENAARLYDLP